MQKFNIFVVEDDQVYSTVLCNCLEESRTFLKDRGVELDYTTYYSGEEAIFDLRNEPNLILLDHHLYNDGLDAADGLETLKKIKLYNDSIAVVVVSGDNDPEVEVSLLASGASYFLPKNADTPIKMREILVELTGVQV